jgi:hypothetical protein
MQDAQITWNEMTIKIRRNDEGCSATQQLGFFQSRQRR